MTAGRTQFIAGRDLNSLHHTAKYGVYFEGVNYKANYWTLFNLGRVKKKVISWSLKSSFTLDTFSGHVSETLAGGRDICLSGCRH